MRNPLFPSQYQFLKRDFLHEMMMLRDLAKQPKRCPKFYSKLDTSFKKKKIDAQAAN